MTMNNVIQAALDSLGYSSNNGNTQLTDRVRKRCRTLFEAEYTELLSLINQEIKPLPEWDKKLPLNPIECNVLIMAVATVIAQSESDDFNYQVFSMRYENAKRGLNHFEQIKDALPNVGD